LLYRGFLTLNASDRLWPIARVIAERPEVFMIHHFAKRFEGGSPHCPALLSHTAPGGWTSTGHAGSYRSPAAGNWNFRNVSIDRAKLTPWIKNDRFAMVAQFPLLPRKRPSRCVALSDAVGQQATFRGSALVIVLLGRGAFLGTRILTTVHGRT